MSERSALNVTGKYNVDNLAIFESEEEFSELKSLEEEAHSKGIGQENYSGSVGDNTTDIDASLYGDLELPAHHPDRLPTDYQFYRTFWGIQRFFRKPNLVLTAETSLNEFISSLKIILDAFEGNSVDHASSSSCVDENGGSLYLTSSRLLRMQLQDNDIRIHILTQCIISTEYFLSKDLPKDGTNLIQNVRDRSKKLLMDTPPDGKEIFGLLSLFLDSREKLWTNWKDNGCTPFDKERAENISVGDYKVAWDTKVEPELKTEGALDDLFKAVPKLEDFVDDYIEALDPESGIEEEYHPKNNPQFCWKALRLLRRNGFADRIHLVKFKGDIEPAIRSAWQMKGISIEGAICDKELEKSMEKDLLGELVGVSSDDNNNKNKLEYSNNDGEDNVIVIVDDEDEELDKSQASSPVADKSGSQSEVSKDVSEEPGQNSPTTDTIMSKPQKLQNSLSDTGALMSNSQKSQSAEKDKKETEIILKSTMPTFHKVFVKNLPENMNALNFLMELERKDVRPSFVDLSPVTRIRMLGVHAMFENVEDAKRAPTVINAINFGRKKLQANYDGILTNPVSDVSKIKVGNLPFNLTEKDFRFEMTAIFGKFKAIEFPKASRDKEREGHNNKGYAFVEFQWPNEADLAIKKLRGISVFGRKPLRIDLMDPRGKRTNMKEVNRSVGSQNDRNGRGVPSQDKKDVQTESPSLSSDKNDLIGKGSQEQNQLKMGRNLRVNVTENIDRRPNGKSSDENGIKESTRRDGSNDEDRQSNGKSSYENGTRGSSRRDGSGDNSDRRSNGSSREISNANGARSSNRRDNDRRMRGSRVNSPSRHDRSIRKRSRSRERSMERDDRNNRRRNDGGRKRRRNRN